MQIEERAEAGVTVLTVSGEITLTSGGGQTIKERAASLVGEGRRHLVLQLGGVTYVDSAGLGQLVQLQLTMSKQGGVLKLANTAPRLRQLMEVAKLTRIFVFYDTEAAAVESFATTGA